MHCDVSIDKVVVQYRSQGEVRCILYFLIVYLCICVFVQCSVSIDKVVVQYRKQREPRCDSSVLTNRLSFLQNQPSGHQIYAARQMKRRKIFKKKTTSSHLRPSSRCNNEAENLDSIGSSGGRKSVGMKMD